MNKVMEEDLQELIIEKAYIIKDSEENVKRGNGPGGTTTKVTHKKMEGKLNKTYLGLGYFVEKNMIPKTKSLLNS